jgi:hypothetical protein
MAGRGPAPKPPEQRRRRNAPEGGEWIDVGPLEKAVLGVADRKWSATARGLWVEWRKDPVTQLYSPADLAAIRELARTFDDLPPNEQRLRMDGLGLTPKGKQGLRWRVVRGEAEVSQIRPASVHRLRVVAPDGA